MRLELLKKRILICSMRIQNMAWAALFISQRPIVLLWAPIQYDQIDQLPPYFECAVSNFQDILNAHRAALGASMISLEQAKNAPNWEAANKIRFSLY